MAEEFGVFNGGEQFLEEEIQGIDIGEDETEELCTKGSQCLVGRLGVAKRIHKEAFKALLTRIWRTVGSVFFKEIQDNLWLFEFSDANDKKKVL